MPATATARPTRVPEVHPDVRASEPTELRRVLFLTLSFFVTVVLGVILHEMWQDEWQTWMLARDSASVRELLRNAQQEGHPPGWYLPLYVLSRFTRSPIVMQTLHVLVATASIFLLARFAPLTWLHKVLLAFSYFLAYEYAVIARSYALGALALFTFCCLYPVRQRHPWVVRGSLLVLASTSVYGLMLAICAYSMLLLEAGMPSGPRPAPWNRTRAGALLTMVLLLAGVVIAGFWASTRNPGGWGWPGAEGPRLSLWTIALAPTKLVEAYLPIPRLSSLHVWNSHFLAGALTSRASLGLWLLVALTMAGAAVLLCIRKPYVLFLYLYGTALLLAFRHFIFIGEMRHTGHFFLLLVACLWLAAQSGGSATLRPALERFVRRFERPARAIITLILLVQVAVAALYYVLDVRFPFSTAPQVARFVQQSDMSQLPIAVNPDPAGTSVGGMLDRPVYYFYNGKPGTFINYQRYQHKDPYWFRVEEILDRAGDDLVLIVGDELVARGITLTDPPAGITITRVASFPPSIQKSESYTVYRVQRRPVPGTQPLPAAGG